MAYVTAADIKLRAGGEEPYALLFDRDGNGTVDADLLAAAIEYAEATIDGELRDSHGGQRFDAPGPVPVLVKDLAARLAIGYAEDLSLTLRNIKREAGQGFKAGALDDLKRISESKGVQLPSGSPAPFAGGGAYVSAPATIFGGTTTSGAGQVLTTGGGGRRTGF